jgi:hypothetical protein
VAQLTIQKNTAASRDEWERVARACDHATFFHTPLWYELLRVQMGARFKPAARAITFSDGCAAVLVAGRDCRWLRSMLHSSPAGTYGGWIGKKPLTPGHACLLADLIAGNRAISWRENPFDPLAGHYDIPGAAEDFTHAYCVDTPGVDPLRGASGGHRRAVRQAREHGIAVRVGGSMEDWRGHFDAYRSSLARWSDRHLRIGSRYSWEFFSALAKANSPHIKLWIAELHGKLLSSMVTFYWNRHAVAWHGGAYAESFHLRPNDLLLETFVHDAREKGYRHIDLNPSAGLANVAAFKDHLGAQRMPHRVLVRRPLWAAIIARLRSRGHRI